MREPIIFFFWLLYLFFFLLVKIFKYIIHGIPDIPFFCVQYCMQVQLSEAIIVLLTLDIQGSSV